MLHESAPSSSTDLQLPLKSFLGEAIPYDIQDGQSGHLLLARGTTLNPDHVIRLQRRGIHYITTSRPTLDTATTLDDLKNITDRLFHSTRHRVEEAVIGRRNTITTAVQSLIAEGRVAQNIMHNPRMSALIEDVIHMIGSEQYHGGLQGLLSLADTHTAVIKHAVETMMVAVLLALDCGEKPGPRLTELAIGTLMHDLGKCAVPDAVHNKPGRLTPEEKGVMDLHPYLSYLMLSSNEKTVTRPALLGGLHHENFTKADKGYGIQSGNPIGTEQKFTMDAELQHDTEILTLADVFSGIKEPRPYRTRQNSLMDTLIIMQHEANMGTINTKLFQRLVTKLQQTAQRPGTIFKLPDASTSMLQLGHASVYRAEIMRVAGDDLICTITDDDGRLVKEAVRISVAEHLFHAA